MSKKRTTKKTAKERKSAIKPIPKGTQILECRECGTPEEKSAGVVSFLCWQCVIDTMWEPLDVKKKKVGFPRGWAFKKVFVHADGRVFHKGVEQPDLKGTLEPTPIIKKEKKRDTRSRAQKEQDKHDLLVQINKLKKEIKKEKRVTYKRKLESQLRSLNKQLKKA